MTITICVGSSCHLKGSRQVTEQLQALIEKHDIRAELKGTFCVGKCQSGVHVSLDGEDFSISPETAYIFFLQQILPRSK